MPVMIRVTSKGGYKMYINANCIMMMEEHDVGLTELKIKGESFPIIVLETMDEINNLIALAIRNAKLTKY